MNAITKLFNRMSIRNKLISIFSIIFVVGFVFNFIVASNKLRDEAIKAVVTEALELTPSNRPYHTGAER